ncbi:MAG: F0F1 ATP synthase subunit A [Gemmatimonadota bacterium]
MNLFGWLAALQGGAQEAAHGGGGESSPNLQGMLMHHLSDGKEIEITLLGHGKVFHLPQWEPIHIGGFALDLSPTKHVVFMLLAALVLLLVFIPMARTMRTRYTDRAPRGFANAMEAMILFFRDEIVRRNIGRGADAYTPYILSLFFFILLMNLFGLLPWGATATGNLSVTGALALLTFIVVEISGMVALGPKGYLRTIFYTPHGMHPAGQAIMLVIMTPVEFLGKLTKPFALAIRLFANMTAGHTLTLSLLGLIFMFANLALGKWAIAGASVAMVSGVMILEVFVALLQAYIFAMLTAVFIGLIRHAH